MKKNDYLDIESLIKKIVDRNFSTYEQERITLLNAILGNIDILISKTEEWFGKNIPDEYIKVIRSLFYLSSYILEKRHSSLTPVKIEKKQDIDIVRLLHEYAKAFETIMGNVIFTISTPGSNFNEKIFFSESVLKEAFFNIFFSLYPFMQNESRCNIHIYSQNLNIVVELFFVNLCSYFPGTSEIKKNLFNYKYGEYERIGIGIDMAISSLKAGGASVRISEIPSEGTCHIALTFPTTTFYSAIEEIKLSQTTSRDTSTGKILISMEDNFMRMFLSDIFKERGYTVCEINLSNIASEIQNRLAKALIIEYSNFSAEIWSVLEQSSHRVIILCSEKDYIDNSISERFIVIRKPFSMEEIFEKIES